VVNGACAALHRYRAEAGRRTYGDSDPHVPEFIRMRHYDFDLRSVELTPDNLAAADCVVIATDHSAFDYEAIRTHARLIVDSRGVYREPAEHIVKA
jgi:UDP-N-acetyl-D-glucosamine dehydrogenase